MPFIHPGKNEYFTRLLSYVADRHVYVTDKSLVPHSPDQLLVYTNFYPSLYTTFPQTTLQVFVNNKLVTQGTLNVSSGLFYANVPVPKDEFLLEVRTLSGTVITNEVYNAKNYALFLDVAAQSYEDRRVAMEQVLKDRSWDTIRTERIYPIIAAFFEFPPPPDWTPQEYRATVLGDGGCKPGLVKAFFEGGTRGGVIDGIRSIVGCATVTITPPDSGDRWVIYDKTHAPNPITGGAEAWYLDDHNFVTAPSHKIVIGSADYYASTSVVTITGSDRVVTGETLYKTTDSFLEGSKTGPYTLAGLTLSFSVEVGGVSTTYATLFNAASDAATAAAEILAQNPSLTSAVYASGGKLRIGIPPLSGTPQTISIIGGSASDVLGFTPGDSTSVGTDYLLNPNQTTPVVLTWSGNTYVQGNDFTLVVSTGEIVWKPSSAVKTNIPPRGSAVTASYTFVPKREVDMVVSRIKAENINIEYVFN